MVARTQNPSMRDTKEQGDDPTKGHGFGGHRSSRTEEIPIDPGLPEEPLKREYMSLVEGQEHNEVSYECGEKIMLTDDEAQHLQNQGVHVGLYDPAVGEAAKKAKKQAKIPEDAPEPDEG